MKYVIIFSCLLLLNVSFANNVDLTVEHPVAIEIDQTNHLQVLKLLNKSIEKDTPIKDLVKKSELYRLNGNHKQALLDLITAQQLLNKETPLTLQALIKINLAQAYQLNQQFDKVNPLLDEGLLLAKRNNQRAILASAYNFKANLEKENSEKSDKLYDLALKNALQTEDYRLISSILLNQSGLNLSGNSYQILSQASKYIEKINSIKERTRLQISLGYRALKHNYFKLAYQSLHKAENSAYQIVENRLLSQAQAYLGQLYLKKNSIQDAIFMTKQAIFSAQQASARDLLLQWEWQLAKLYDSTGQNQKSLASYRRAVEHIQAIRQDIPVFYQDGQSSFRETLAPIYLELVEQLLEYSSHQKEHDQQKLLTEALTIIERLKTAEMQDYFKDACAVEQSELHDLNQFAPGSAVIYPIILRDHLDILVQIADKKYHHRVPVPLKTIKRLVSRLNSSLRPRPGGYFRSYYKGVAKELYQLLIKPLEANLKNSNIHTLVNAPDGFLRQLPLSALWTGSHFLIEDYAIVTVPGMTLMDIKASKRKQVSALVAGVSRPGDVVDELPEEMQQILAFNEPEKHGLHRGVRLRALPQGKAIETDLTLAHPLTDQVKLKLQDALQLPGVVDEVKSLETMIPTVTLLDEDFKLNNFEKEIAKNYGIVHIASHGLFSGTPEKSFLIAHDKVLNMNKLESYFKSEAFSDSPIEILTLSACQTAEGDDRSPLGLSGVAIKSGARSALGSLWPVSDEVAKQLLPDFYQNLTDLSLTKAQALQKAKIKLLKQNKFQHPGLWSSFILIGNWL